MTLSTKLSNQWKRTVSEASLHLRALSRTTSGSDAGRVLFFPSAGREGASLLRAYNMADALSSLGWQTSCVSPLVRADGRRRIIASFAPDLLIFQQSRHPLNAPEHAYGVPYVLDTDDADFYLKTPGLAERLERTSRKAAGVIAGSRFLRDWHAERCSQSAVVWTGSPVSIGERIRHDQRERHAAPILAWAQAKPLAYREELDFVARLVTRVRERQAGFVLRCYGISSPSEADELRSRLPPNVPVQTLPPLPYPDFVRSLNDVAVGLSPVMAQSPFSRGKSFGKILGYLDAQVPIIASDEADHALFFDGKNGIVSNSLDEWSDWTVRLLTSAADRQAMADRAFADFQTRLSLQAAAERTDRFLRRMIDRPCGGSRV